MVDKNDNFDIVHIGYCIGSKWWNQGITSEVFKAKGIIETGLEFGLSESDILIRLHKKLDVSLQVAQEYLTMFGKKIV